jgi:hypothetical protein
MRLNSKIRRLRIDLPNSSGDFTVPDLEQIETSSEIIGSFDLEQLRLETLLFQTQCH